MTNYPTFIPGQKVRTIYGQVRTVIRQNGCQVFLVGEFGSFHPTKVSAI